MEKRMHAAVEAKREEILAFVRELVSIRSVTGQEAPVAAAVEKSCVNWALMTYRPTAPAM
ncbi:MAG: hypothetical protein ACLUFI_12070 [Oscillospiraceae bacterium]